jgi:hypothetical protein
LAGLTTYTATITTGAQDLAGNALATPYVWTFTTVADPVVGGEAKTINKANVLLPWIFITLIIAVFASAFILRRRINR